MSRRQGCLEAGRVEWELQGRCLGQCFLLSPEVVRPRVRGAPVGRRGQAECASMYNAMLAFQVQWPDGQASSDAFWGARVLLELSGGSLG